MKALYSASILSLTLFAACGGTGTGESQTGSMTFAITDAASDEVASFRVEVESIVVTDLDGTVFDVLAAPVEVDLAQLSDLSQILGHVTIGDGRYREAEITLDFTNAKCFLVGQTTPAALKDVTGSALTGLVTLPIEFAAPGMGLFAGRHRVVEFDFDLDQSLAVNSLANEVVVEPVVVLRVSRDDDKQYVAFGRINTVNGVTRAILVDLETLGGAPLGEVIFETDDTTAFQVDGVPSLGAAGIAAVGALPAGTWIQAYGSTDVAERNFQASYVEAGAGTFNGGQDIVEGFIVGRTGAAGADATLTVLGYGVDSTHTTYQFHTTFTVNTSFASTKVLPHGGSTALDTDDLNVGQRVRAFGDLGGTTLDCTAASGVVRTQPTRVFGLANGAPVAGILEIDLTRVGLLADSDFAWSEGGTTPPDPDLFKIDVSAIATVPTIVAGTPIESWGSFPAVDDAGADFVAATIADRSDSPSYMIVRDRFAGMLVDVTTNAGSLVFDITGAPGAGELAVIDQGLVGQTPLPTSPQPSVIPAAAVLCMLYDKDTGALNAYNEFDDFSSALGIALSSAGRLSNFAALGQYDEAENELTAVLIVAVVD
jgi:hypothetical protein